MSRRLRPGFVSRGALGWIVAAVLLAVLFVRSAVEVGEASDAATAPSMTRAVLDAQVTAWNAGDLEEFMAGYRKSDGLTFYSGDTVTSGWQATFDRYKKRYQSDGKEMGTLTFSDVEAESLGPDAALVRGKWRLAYAKSPETPHGLFTLVMRKRLGRWEIVHDHTSIADPPKKVE